MPGGGGGTPKLEERGGRGGMGGGGSPMRGRAAGGRLKKGRMEGGFSRRVGGSAFSVGVARPSRESAESREWALGGTPASGTGRAVSCGQRPCLPLSDLLLFLPTRARGSASGKLEVLRDRSSQPNVASAYTCLSKRVTCGHLHSVLGMLAFTGRRASGDTDRVEKPQEMGRDGQSPAS